MSATYPSRTHQAIVALAGVTALGEQFLDHWADDDDIGETLQAQAARAEFDVHRKLLADVLAEREVLLRALAGLDLDCAIDGEGEAAVEAARKLLDCEYCGAVAGEDCMPDCLPEPEQAPLPLPERRHEPWATAEGVAAREAQKAWSTLIATTWTVWIATAIAIVWLAVTR